MEAAVAGALETAIFTFAAYVGGYTQDTAVHGGITNLFDGLIFGQFPFEFVGLGS